MTKQTRYSHNTLVNSTAPAHTHPHTTPSLHINLAPLPLSRKSTPYLKRPPSRPRILPILNAQLLKLVIRAVGKGAAAPSMSAIIFHERAQLCGGEFLPVAAEARAYLAQEGSLSGLLR
jgi:hypothetical protein